ncbi:hypothetical protein N9M53_02580 [Alphaproteobacteria bacterium]|mgnify:FL=1|jgi:hypothetical protein|nr:hypothetical protein [Alphaproteobacteria bacterium]
MSDTLVENYFSIIERLLDGALSASAGSEASMTSDDVQTQLAETLGLMQADMDEGKITLTPADKTRLVSLMEKISTLESYTHAHLSWFNDLSKRFQREDDS